MKLQTPAEQTLAPQAETQAPQAEPPAQASLEILEQAVPKVEDAAEECAEVAGTIRTAVEAEPVMDMELEAELPVIPEVHPGIKAETLEDSETTAEPKDEESPRLFGRLKVEAAPELSQGPCLCTNLW